MAKKKTKPDRTRYLFELETEDSWVCPSCMSSTWSSNYLYHISERGDISSAIKAFLEKRDVYCYGCVEKELLDEIFGRFGEEEFDSRRYCIAIEFVKIPDDIARDIEVVWLAEESNNQGGDG
jgi:hypothetical protein